VIKLCLYHNTLKVSKQFLFPATAHDLAPMAGVGIDFWMPCPVSTSTGKAWDALICGNNKEDIFLTAQEKIY